MTVRRLWSRTARAEHPGEGMAEEPDATRRKHIAEDHPDMPGEVVDGLARLEKINEERDGTDDDCEPPPEAAR